MIVLIFLRRMLNTCHLSFRDSAGIQRSEIQNFPQLRLWRNITFGASRKYHLRKAQI